MKDFTNLAKTSRKLSFPIIHIAGTNGKGSTATKIARALYAAGYKVGLFTSPHIHCYEERIQVNFAMIPSSFHQALQFSNDLSFFEKATLTAMHYFTKQNIDVGVIEVGMGGRLDATNWYESIMAIITSISLDHMQYLGTTLEEIAFEKAGIIKSDAPVVIGPNASFKPIHAAARKYQATLYEVKGEFAHFDAENSAIAKTALQALQQRFTLLSKESIDYGLAHRPPCRFETIDGIIFDVAHNPDGFKKLLSWVKKDHPGKKIALAAGFSKDKPLQEIFEVLAQEDIFFILTTSSHEKMAPIEEVAASMPRALAQKTLVIPQMQQALSYMKETLDHSWVKVFSGSFYLMNYIA